MKFKILTIFSLAVILLSSQLIHAHGVMSKIDTGGIVVSAMYDTGDAMDYARVTISAPGANLKFQSGRTDRNGRFCFFPDVSGDWKVVVDDEMGHRLEVHVPVDEAMALQANRENENTGPGFLAPCQKTVMGVSIIFGISGILFWLKGRKTEK